jgi:hypothetical protein
MTENMENKIEELNETMENLDLGEQLGDFMICCGSISDKSTDTWKTGLELHEDDQTIFSSCCGKFDNQYQILAIIGDNSEEFDDNNNPVLNPANVTRGANHLAEGDNAESLTTRAKIRLSADEWNTIKAAIEHGTAIPVDASKEVLQRYIYAIHRQSRQLAKEKSEIRKRSRESKISSTQIDETSPETLTHLSYQSMSKAISCQKHPKQHSWWRKNIYILRSQTQGTQENTCIEQHCRVNISRKQVGSQRRGGTSQQRYAQTQITAPSQ